MPPGSATSFHGPVTIFHLVSSLDVGGTQTGMLQTIRRLDPVDFRSVVCSVMPSGRIAARMEEEGIRTCSLGITSPWDLRAVPRLLPLLKNEGPQILHSYLFHANLLGRIAGRLAGVPAIVNSERSVNQLGQSRVLLSRMTSSLATAVETNSGAGREYVLSTLGVSPGKTHVIYPGVELPKRQPGDGRSVRGELDLGYDSPLIGFVGRLYPVKGGEQAIRAFAAVVQGLPQARLIVAGDGPERRRLEEIAVSLGVGQTVQFLGYREDVHSIMAAIDALAIPSLTESLPRAALEAMAAGKPVVATRVGGIPEVVEDGVTGLLAEPGDTAGLARSLVRLLSDGTLARRMGDRGREKVEKIFSASASVARYEQLYRLVLDGRKSGAFGRGG